MADPSATVICRTPTYGITKNLFGCNSDFERYLLGLKGFNLKFVVESGMPFQAIGSSTTFYDGIRLQCRPKI